MSSTIEASDYEFKALPKPKDVIEIASDNEENEELETDSEDDMFFSNPKKINWNSKRDKKRATKTESGSPKKKLTTKDTTKTENVPVEANGSNQAPEEVNTICIDSDSDSDSEIGPMELSKIQGITNEKVLHMRKHHDDIQRARMESERRLDQIRMERKAKREQGLKRSHTADQKKMISFDDSDNESSDDDESVKGATLGSSGAAVSSNATPGISVRFRRSVQGKLQISAMKVQQTEKFGDIVKRYVDQFAQGTDPASVYCEIDGERIGETETPDDYDLDEDDLLEVKNVKK